MIANRAVSLFKSFCLKARRFDANANGEIIWSFYYFFHIDSSSKKSCQGCELPSDDIPDSTSSSRGHNNNTPSATNNNSKNLGNGMYTLVVHTQTQTQNSPFV